MAAEWSGGRIFAAFALVGARRPDILQRHLPNVHHRPVDHAVVGRRDFQHHRAGVLGIEERHQINHVGIRSERLVLPVRQARPIDDLIGLTLGAADHRLEHQLRVDRRHAPDDRLDCAPLNGAAGEILGRKILRLRRCRHPDEREYGKNCSRHVDLPRNDP